MTNSERASQIWAVLALAARNRQILTYEIVGSLVGLPHYGLGATLEHIQSYCLLHKLPPLTILVVKQGTGLPGEGFTASAGDFGKRQLEVFDFDWLELGAPSPAMLQQAVEQLPSRGTSTSTEQA